MLPSCVIWFRDSTCEPIPCLYNMQNLLYFSPIGVSWNRATSKSSILDWDFPSQKPSSGDPPRNGPRLTPSPRCMVSKGEYLTSTLEKKTWTMQVGCKITQKSLEKIHEIWHPRFMWLAQQNLEQKSGEEVRFHQRNMSVRQETIKQLETKTSNARYI